MRDCPHCGHGVRLDAAFCPSCGLAVPDALTPERAATLVEPPEHDLDGEEDETVGSARSAEEAALRQSTELEFAGTPPVLRSDPPTAPRPQSTIQLDFDLDAPTVQASSANLLPLSQRGGAHSTLLGGFVSEPPPTTAGRPQNTAVSVAPPPPPPSEPRVPPHDERPKEETRTDVPRPRSGPPEAFATQDVDPFATQAVDPFATQTVDPFATQAVAPPPATLSASAMHGGVTSKLPSSHAGAYDYAAPQGSPPKHQAIWWAVAALACVGAVGIASYSWLTRKQNSAPEFAATVQVDSYGRNYIGLSCRSCADGTGITLLRQSGEFKGRTASIVLPPLAACGLTRIPVSFTPPGGAPVAWDADVNVPASMRADLSKVSEVPSLLRIVGCVAEGTVVQLEGQAWNGSPREVEFSPAVIGAAEATQALKKSVHYTITSKNGAAVQGELSVSASVTPLRDLGVKPVVWARNGAQTKTFVLQTLPDARATIGGAPAAIDTRGVFEVPLATPTTTVSVRVVRAGMVARELNLGP